MEAHLVALKLVFDGVGTEVDVSTFESRKLLQKVVYLVQRSGLDLSYRFAWDEKGPYCRSLSLDNRELVRNLELGDDSWNEFDLQEKYCKALEVVKKLSLAKPAEDDLKAHDWMELLASIDYLVTVDRMTIEEARDALHAAKGHLMHDFPHALDALGSVGLVPA